ncbi:MAG: glutathione S-transferase N-terminal domain-containing protein [Candidatus Micrarchaeota archaeon]|nr:glutathione S-transferase N-terminal domain-containing protein [Candidatus Micrarchaeota archaeon]
MRVDISDRDLEGLSKPEAGRAGHKKSGIILYKTPTCPYCYMAADYLRGKGVEFKEVDVSIDQMAALEMVRKSGQMGVPVIDINGAVIVGFDRQAIDYALSKAKR